MSASKHGSFASPMGLLLRISFRNLFRNGRRSLLTGFSLATGLAGVLLLGAYILRMERYLAVQSIYLNYQGHVIVYAKNGLEKHLSEPQKYSFTAQDLQLLQEIGANEKVEIHSGLLRVAGLVHNGCNSFPYSALAADPKVFAWARNNPRVKSFVPELAKVSKGRGFWEIEGEFINISPRLAMILQKEALEGEGSSFEGIPDCTKAKDKESIKKDPSVQLLGNSFSGGMALADASISGLLSTGMAYQDDTALFLPTSLAQRMYDTGSYTAYIYFLKSEKDIPAFLSLVKQKIPHLDSYAFSEEAVSPFYVGGMQFNWIMLYLFLGLVCSVVGISISNSLYISMMERRFEFGTLRSIGFPGLTITKLMLWENSFLSVLSFVPGFLFSLLVCFLVNQANIRLTIPGLAGDIPLRLHITATYTVLVLLLIYLLVVAITWWGTRKYLKKSILELLGSAS